MSSNEDKCFQCQESGHVACYCPHIRLFDCNDYDHVTADCPDKIPPLGIPARHRDNNSHPRRCHRSTSQNNHCDRHQHHDHQDQHRFSRSRSHSHSHRYRSDSCSDSQRSQSRSYHQPTHCSTSCHRSSSTYVTDETPHTADPHHTEVFPEIAVDPDHIHHTNTTTKHQQDYLPALIKQPGKPKTGNISRSPSMIHHLSTIAWMSKPVTQKMI